MRRLLTITLLAAGCTGPVPVYLNAFDGSLTSGGHVERWYHMSEELRDVMNEGFGFWGLEYELVGPGTVIKRYGSIELTVVPLQEPCGAPGGDEEDGCIQHGGQTTRDRACRRRIIVGMDGLSLAHELGHLFELDHVQDEGNIMDEFGRGDEYTDDQWDDLHDEVRSFHACADGAG